MPASSFTHPSHLGCNVERWRLTNTEGEAHGARSPSIPYLLLGQWFPNHFSKFQNKTGVVVCTQSMHPLNQRLSISHFQTENHLWSLKKNTSGSSPRRFRRDRSELEALATADWECQKTHCLRHLNYTQTDFYKPGLPWTFGAHLSIYCVLIKLFKHTLNC